MPSRPSLCSSYASEAALSPTSPPRRPSHHRCSHAPWPTIHPSPIHTRRSLRSSALASANGMPSGPSGSHLSMLRGAVMMPEQAAIPVGASVACALAWSLHLGSMDHRWSWQALGQTMLAQAARTRAGRRRKGPETMQRFPTWYTGWRWEIDFSCSGRGPRWRGGQRDMTSVREDSLYHDHVIEPAAVCITADGCPLSVACMHTPGLLVVLCIV
jgi:hypothetical protein